MITTESTITEMNEYLQPIREILNKRSWNKAASNYSKLRKYFKANPLACINSTMFDGHYTQDGIRFTGHFVGAHQQKKDGLMGLMSHGYWIYFFLNDIHTGKRVLCITSDRLLVNMIDTHALSRYRERFLKDTSLPFEKVAETLVSRNVAYHQITFSAIYGTRENTRIESNRCLDGVFLGYIDYKTQISYFTTFLSDDMLSDRQFYHSKDSDVCKRVLPIMEKLRTEANFAHGDDWVCDMRTDVVDGKTVVVEMTQDEIDAMREEYENDPEGARESRRAEVQRQKFEHQKRYKLKMKKKGYK